MIFPHSPNMREHIKEFCFLSNYNQFKTNACYIKLSYGTRTKALSKLHFLTLDRRTKLNVLKFGEFFGALFTVRSALMKWGEPRILCIYPATKGCLTSLRQIIVLV